MDVTQPCGALRLGSCRGGSFLLRPGPPPADVGGGARDAQAGGESAPPDPSGMEASGGVAHPGPSGAESQGRARGPDPSGMGASCGVAGAAGKGVSPPPPSTAMGESPTGQRERGELQQEACTHRPTARGHRRPPVDERQQAEQAQCQPSAGRHHHPGHTPPGVRHRPHGATASGDESALSQPQNCHPQRKHQDPPSRHARHRPVQRADRRWRSPRPYSSGGHHSSWARSPRQPWAACVCGCHRDPCRQRCPRGARSAQGGKPPQR